MLLDAFYGDIDACTTVAVVLMPARPTLEPLLVAVRSLGVLKNSAPVAHSHKVEVDPAFQRAR
jgi:hypothetical protein